MIYALTFISLLSTFLDLGTPLSCIHCMNTSDTQCSGKAVSCPSEEYACASGYGMTLMTNMEVSKMFLRLCVERSMCDQAGSVGFLGGRMKTSTTCCYTNNCSPPMPVLSLDIPQKNGVSCKTCFKMMANKCSAKTIMHCTGKEDRCISQVSKISGPKSSVLALQGCSTKEACEGMKGFDLGFLKIESQVKCSNGNANLQPFLLTLLPILCFILKPLSEYFGSF